MESFNDLITRWQPFFSAVAGVTATLAGLLFVSLSINREKITAQENRKLLRLAQRSFADYLYALFISLMFLMPNHESFGLAIPLFMVVAVRVWFLVRVMRRSRKGENPATLGGLRENVIQIISCLGLVAAGVEIYRGEVIATFFLVPVIALLLCNASMNAWLLLVMERAADEKSSDAKLTVSETTTYK
ncbi:hypothetical protein [Pedosphaera parvula]|uniref:Uncharacterized protein n=1 Tax=Pedosphaera parvula (strain Ellin514) TaxID=320771 RepID=B9XQ31_PEDPL|nr:hypothetical protein [Pedosphaera parvula]EEF58035.1 hypothetical protein Cflav_PD1172 [Pedosphaera parvula Ellin514]